MAETAGITIEWDTMSDSLATQVNLKIAGEQLPDAFMGVGFSQVDINQHGTDGVFIDLTPYINEETMPNLTAILEKHPDIRSSITMADGCIYGLPSAEQMGTAGFGFTNWPNDVCNDLILNEDGTCEFICVSDKYRDAVTYFHKWYDEGLMDIEMFSQNDNQLIAKCNQGNVGVTTWWYIEEIMGSKADDYVFLPILDGPDGSHKVTVRDGGAVTSGNLNVTRACGNPAALLKFFDLWYTGEAVMQLQYGPIDVYFTEKDENGLWKSITDEEAKEKFNKSAGELKGVNEVYGPKLILSEYYNEVFRMEDRAITRLEDLKWWMEDSGATTVTYPIDCVFTTDELEVIDRYKADFESSVAEQESLWLKNGGPTDDEWNEYGEMLSRSCGMDRLLEVYQAAYDRYAAAQK